MLSPDMALLALFGLLAGVLAGFFGIGGGILFTPLLFTLYGDRGFDNPVAWAVGSSLFCTFVASLSSSVQQFRAGNLQLGDGLRVGLFGVAGVWLGKKVTLSAFYTEGIFVTFFAFLLAIVAVLFYIKPATDEASSGKTGGKTGGSAGKGNAGTGDSDGEPASEGDPKSVAWRGALRLPQTVLTGGVGGFLAALAGIGGGVAMVPILNLGYGVRLYRAVSVSSLAIVLISLSGWLQFAMEDTGRERSGPPLEYQVQRQADVPVHVLQASQVTQIGMRPGPAVVDAVPAAAAEVQAPADESGADWTLGYIDFHAVLPLAIGTWIGGFLGVNLNQRVPEEVAAIGFALLTMTVAVVMVLRVL